jgi:nucleotide-binding universal stress UspA family protein
LFGTYLEKPAMDAHVILASRKSWSMINLRKILVTTDLSEHSLAAFEHAFSLGLLYASRIYVLYVADNAPPLFALYGSEGDVQVHALRIEEAGVQKLDQFMTNHIGTEKKVVPVVRSGIPEEEIMQFAEHEGMDLIVMATHGWTGLKHILLGSVAEKVVRRSLVPVLTVKPKPMREEIVRKEDVEKELHLR